MDSWEEIIPVEGKGNTDVPKTFQVCVLQGSPGGWSPVTRKEEVGDEIREQENLHTVLQA